MNEGFWPQGGNPHYSRRPVSIPTLTDYRGSVHASRWEDIKNRMYNFAVQQAELQAGQRSPIRGQRGWVYYPGGYRQFRKSVGLKASFVDLQLTGKMMDDLVVNYKTYQSERPVRAATNASGISQNIVVGSVELELDWATTNSRQIAHYIETGQFPRPFSFWTDEEVQTIRRIMKDYFDEYGSRPGRDRFGRFLPVGF